jgi:hypothetical protein
VSRRAPSPDRDYQPPTPATLDRRLRAADRPGAHLWIMTAGWLIADPATVSDPDVIKWLDRENLVVMAGPGCYKCEEPWSPELEARICRGRL